MKKIVLTLLALALLASCNEKQKESAKEEVKKVEKAVEKAEEKTADALSESVGGPKVLKTKTGKSFEVKTTGNGSLVSVTITPKGFEFGEPMELKDVDPVSEIFLADLNKDGFEELYIVTTATGSGSYATLYGFSSNKDKSVTPITVAQISETDLKGKFKGYQGHDTFYVEKGVLYRKFPVYKDGDTNAKPTGGEKVVAYVLKPGEATWQLVVK